MKKCLFLVVLVTFLCSGCAYYMVPERDQLLMTNRYAELERHMEASIQQSASPSTAELSYLCTAYSKLKKYDKLFRCLDKMERNIARGDTMVNFYDFSAVPHVIRADAYIDFGKYEKAVEEAQKAYQLVTEKDLSRWSRIQSLSVLALSYAMSGSREAAGIYADKLDQVGTAYPFSILISDKSMGLARTYLSLGQYEKALSSIRNVEEESGFRAFTNVVAGSSLAGEDIFTFSKLPEKFLLNKCLLETGNFAEAKTGFDDLLQNPRTRNNGDIYWMILYDRGRIAEREGKLKEAIDFYRPAIDVIEQQRSTINTEASKIGFVGDKQNVYSRLIGALYSDGQYASAFEYVERSKSRALVDLLASKQDFSVKTGNEQQVRNLLDADKKAETEILAQETTPEKSRTRGVAINSRQQLHSISPELSSLVSVTSLSVSEIQSLVPPDEALVEYYYSDKDMFAFVLTKEGLKSVRLAGGNLAEEIRKFRNLLQNPDSGDYLSEARSLYRILVQPLGDMANKRNLTIVAHGALHYLPFSALNDGNVYLIEHYSIRMLPSASVMKYLHAKKSSKPANILAFGNPDLGDPRYDLRYAQEEARAVAHTFPRAMVLLRKDATETAFKKYGADYNYIHFATHGQFNSEAPLKSSVLLAGDTENDGNVTVDKLYSMKLNADLVTLSACETGLGKIANGDDIVGLTRGFLYAGSSSVVASLWKVDDLSTSDLMTKFYSLLEKTNKREALRQAQFETRAKHPHPYYWASFQLTGNSE